MDKSENSRHGVDGGDMQTVQTFLSREGYRIDVRLRQHMAPILVRMIECLENLSTRSKGLTDMDLAKSVHADRSSVVRYIRALHQAGIIRIASWDTEGIGDYDRRWVMADGKPDAPRPATPTNADRTKKRRDKIRALFGKDAHRVLQSRRFGGRDIVVRDGVTLYRRGVGVNYAAAESVLHPGHTA